MFSFTTLRKLGSIQRRIMGVVSIAAHGVASVGANENRRRHFTEQRRGVELGAELDHPSGQELAPHRPLRSGSGTGSVASGGVPRMSRRPGKRATATSMAASHTRREKAQT